MKGFFNVKESKPYGVIFVVQPDDEIVERHGGGRETNALTQPPVGHSHHYTYQIDLELVK